jgi:hypothetical protein
MSKENELTMLFEAPVTKVAPLHHDWKNHYTDETEEEQPDGSKEDC